MRKIGKLVLTILMIITVSTFCSYAKTSGRRAKFFNDIVNQENYVSSSESIDVGNSLPNIEEKDVESRPIVTIPKRSETKNICESIIAVVIVVSFVLYIIKVLCKNFKIPFDYDPNIKSKHVVHRRLINKKFLKR